MRNVKMKLVWCVCLSFVPKIFFFNLSYQQYSLLWKLTKRKGNFIIRCRELAWGAPPMAKVMRKEAQHTQKRDQASGVPLEILEHLPPKPESAYFTTLCSHLHLWLYGGLSPTTSFGEGVNLELQLIIIPGHDRSVSTYTASQPWEARDTLNLLKTGSLEKLENY